MLGTIQFQGEARIGTEKIDLQRASTIEGDRQWLVQREATSGLGKRLQAPVEKRLRRAPSPREPVGVGHNGASGVHEELSQRTIDAIANQSTDGPDPISWTGEFSRISFQFSVVVASLQALGGGRIKLRVDRSMPPSAPSRLGDGSALEGDIGWAVIINS